MNEHYTIIPENIESIKIETISETLSTFIEYGTEMAVALFNANEAAVIYETATEISSEIIKASKVITVTRKAASIPDKFFMNKMEKYCRGLIVIPEDKRKKYAKKVGKARLNKDSVFILGVLNKVEELSKIDILLKLFEAKIDGSLDDETYRRLTLMVDRTMFSDLQYLKDNIVDEAIPITNDSEQGLLASGWLYYCGQTWGTETEESQLVYNYTSAAKHFCELMNN